MAFNNTSQLHLSQCFKQVSSAFESDKAQFFNLLTQHLNLSTLIPASFFNHYYSSLGADRLYSLESMLSFFIIKSILSIPEDSTLIAILKLSSEFRDFCGFSSVPHKSRFSRFRSEFFDDISSLFEHLVDVTEPICQSISTIKSSTLIIDSSGIEAFVKENNPKFINSIISSIKQSLKSSSDKKLDKKDLYAIAYSKLPASAEKDSSIRKMYANGHFCYARKFSIIVNALGIPRHIDFLDDDFKFDHSIHPDDNKSIYDSSSLIPAINSFYSLHPHLKGSHKVFLGDAGYDSASNFSFLINDLKFEIAVIPLNPRNSKPNSPIHPVDDNGIPLCPKDSSLKMKYHGICKQKGRCTRFKWLCPKSDTSKRIIKCTCDTPCTPSSYGRVTYTYPEKESRLYPGIVRNSDKWNKLYKIRPIVERSINHLKEVLACGVRKTRKNVTIKADIMLGAITQLFTVIVADSMHRHEYIRSLKPLVV